MSNLNGLTAISPIDGRYRNTCKIFADYFSEYALIKHRLWVEVEYFIALVELPLEQLKDFPKDKISTLRNIIIELTITDAEKIKATEKITNHDVKSVEYFLKEKFTSLGLDRFSEFIHFGLTSQDINNTAIPLSLKKCCDEVFIASIQSVIDKTKTFAHEWKNVSMLARTHGQPASPTSLGKELMVFVERITLQLDTLKQNPYPAKFGGATGNFNAHHVAYPNIKWVEFANNFVSDKLGLSRSQHTTQIEHYDFLAAWFDNVKRINTILIDFSRDIWTYISMEYFKQKINEGEIGSSAMPHKVNPIDFENAEGNLGVANALFEHFSAKLPVSRLQRDLTDSTVLRNMGVPIAHSYLAYESILKGLNKIILNEKALHADLEKNWVVIGEAIQTILRREGYAKPYEVLKRLTRTNVAITQKEIHDFIDTLNMSDAVKQELKKISPHNYTGILNF
ncbi:MAG TPA: adenylosuccinate lyase [Bacteroidia bacterium]